jgi:hypothetical protein
MAKPIMSSSLYIKTNEVTVLWENLKISAKSVIRLKILNTARGSLPFTTIMAIYCNLDRIYS